MRSLFLLLLCLMLPFFSRAAESTESDWGGSVTVAPEIRGVKDVNDNYESLNFLNLAAGVRYQNWNFMLEFGSSDTQSSGNATLSVDTKMQDVLAWGYWNTPESWYHLSPLLGAGLGAYQTKVTTTLSGVATEDDSPWKLLGGGAIGLKLNIPIVWVSVEARMLFGDELNPQPTLTGLARIGFGF